MNNDPPNNSYVGPRPFGLEDRELFFGREREIDEAVSSILAHPLVLMYAASGAGKTSLVNAGIIPALLQEGFEVFPPARVGFSYPGSEDANNIYVFNALASILGTDSQLNPELKQMTFASFLAKEGTKHSSDEMIPLRILVFDQLEELFTSFPERWHDRRGFFQQISEALEIDPYLRVVLVMREDYIAGLDPYASILPGNLRIRFRIQRLSRNAALKALEGPGQLYGKRFDPGVAERLVDDLLTIRVRDFEGEWRVSKGEHVEPVQLQVVCSTLWDHLSPDENAITMQHVESIGNVQQALLDFYENSIHSAVAREGIDEAVLRRWFEHSLITPFGTRGTSLRGKTHTGGLPNHVVDLLDQWHLIRGEWRGGAIWYELSHDRLIDPIRESNRKWLLHLSLKAQRLQALEAQASEWQQIGQMPLLKPVEVLEAKQLMADPDLFISHAARELVATSENSIVQAHSRERLLIRALVIITILAILVAIVGWLR